MSIVKSVLKRLLTPPQVELANRVFVNRKILIDGAGYLPSLAVVFGSDKWGLHSYAKHYAWHFAALRWKRLTLLEIGVGGEDNPLEGGGSLRAWKWFFPRGRIVGIDIFDKSVHDERRVRTFKGSQGDSQFLRSVVAEIGMPDIIIDDGSHRNEHVIASFETLFPLLRDGGIYIVEDMQTSYWPAFGGGRGAATELSPPSSMEFFKHLMDGLNHVEYLEPDYVPTYYDKHIVSMHFYHNLMFIHKGRNDEQSNCVRDGELHI